MSEGIGAAPRVSLEPREKVLRSDASCVLGHRSSPEMDSLTLPYCWNMLVETTIPVLAQPPRPSGLVSQPHRHTVPHPCRDVPCASELSPAPGGKQHIQ